MICDELMKRTWIFVVTCVRLLYFDVKSVTYSCKSNSGFYLTWIGRKFEVWICFHGEKCKNRILQRWQASSAWQSNRYYIGDKDTRLSTMTCITYMAFEPSAPHDGRYSSRPSTMTYEISQGRRMSRPRQSDCQPCYWSSMMFWMIFIEASIPRFNSLC